MDRSIYARPRFDDGASIAFWIDADGGYRRAADQQWRLVRIRDIVPPSRRPWERQVLDLSLVVAPRDGALPVRVVPVSASRVQVEAPMRLVTRAHERDLPHLVDGPAEVSYGTVVRAGPVLFAVLYAEHVESLAEGRITLPFVGGLTDLARDEGIDRFIEPFERRTRVAETWTTVMTGVFLLSGVAAIAFVLSRGVHFCFGDSTVDTVSACVAAVLLTWALLLVPVVPVYRAILGWVYRPEGEVTPRRDERRR